VDRDRDHSRGRLAQHALALAIFAGTLVLWIGIPLASLWVVSQLVENALTVWLIVLIVCPLSMLLFAGVLARLDDLHLRLSGSRSAGRRASLKGLTGESVPGPGRSVLEVSMLVSVAVALVALLAWYAFVANGG
jgi:hypothetical protein